jgi:hypothetical protein
MKIRGGQSTRGVRARVSIHDFSQAEELAKRRRARSVDHTGLEVEEHRAGHLLAVRGLVVKHVDAAELHVVVAAVLAVAADAVLVAHHLPRPGSHLVTALARLHVKNLARRSSLEAGSTLEKKGEEERRNARNSVWQFGTGNRKFRRRARVHPKRENEVILPPLPLELFAPCKARWVWAGAAAQYLFW